MRRTPDDAEGEAWCATRTGRGMERDLVGAGEGMSPARWPHEARIALNFVVNYEEGAENRFEDGCTLRETIGDVPSSVPPEARHRDLANESMFEYGSRAGVWRILRTFDRHRIPVTFFLCALAVERNPAVGRAISSRGHDVCAHGYRWEQHFLLDRAREQEAIRRAVASLRATTGQSPGGWYCRYGPSVHTRELVASSGAFLYDSDAYNDDLPYYVAVGDRPWLVVPYSLETNDIQFWNGRLATGGEFFEYLRDTFDVLYAEGATHPKLMSVGLHCRIAGRPGRSVALERFLEYVSRYDGVWYATRSAIARWWWERHPPT
jgi:peptidoglycan/xylan/chitin deacetylase (PgdA/CDA1 family)